MEQNRLDKDLIKDPRLWRLALRIDDKKMHVVLFCSVEDNSLIYREIPLDIKKNKPAQKKGDKNRQDEEEEDEYDEFGDDNFNSNNRSNNYNQNNSNHNRSGLRRNNL